MRSSTEPESGTSRATPSPRSVTTIVPPRFTSLTHSLRRDFNSRIPTFRSLTSLFPRNYILAECGHVVRRHGTQRAKARRSRPPSGRDFWLERRQRRAAFAPGVGAQRLQVIAAQEGGRFLDVDQAHAAAHLADGNILVLLHPAFHAGQLHPDVLDAVLQQRRGHHV